MIQAFCYVLCVMCYVGSELNSEHERPDKYAAGQWHLTTRRAKQTLLVRSRGVHV